MAELHAQRRALADEPGDALRGVPGRWPMVWAVTCLAAFVAAWWLVVPHDPTDGLQLGPVDPTAGIDGADLQRIHEFNAWASPFELAAIVLPVVAVLLVGLTPAGARLTAHVASRVHLQSLRALLIAFAVVGIAWAVALPAEAGLEVVQQESGTYTGRWPVWSVDRLEQLFRWWALVGVAVLLVRVAARLLRRWWWVALTLVVFGLVLVGAVAFGRLSSVGPAHPPLPDGPLRSDVFALADQIGVDVTDVQVVPESPASGQYNAYVTGVGTDRVVVLHEMLLTQSTPAEARLVAAHELGHVAADDSLRRAVLLGLGAAFATALVGAAATSRRVRRASRTQAVRIADAPAVPMLIALTVAAGIIVMPVIEAASRAFETRADVTALEATDDPVALREVVSRSAALYLREPHPLWLWRMLSGHPSAAERAALAEAWARGG